MSAGSAKSKSASKSVEPSMDEIQERLKIIEEEEAREKAATEKRMQTLAENKKTLLEVIAKKADEDKAAQAASFVPLFDRVKGRGYFLGEILRKAFDSAGIKDLWIAGEDPEEMQKRIRALESKIKKQDNPKGSTGRSRAVFVKFNRADYESSNPSYFPISFGGRGDEMIKNWWKPLSKDQQELNKENIKEVDAKLSDYLIKCAKGMDNKADNDNMTKSINKKYSHLFELTNPSQIVIGS